MRLQINDHGRREDNLGHPTAAKLDIDCRAHIEVPHERGAVITSGWAPYRTWVSSLLRVNLQDSTHEISGARRRAARG
jgi:hypothetical protein